MSARIDEAMVERAARAMFEGVGGISPGDYSWADVVREDRIRADLWRADARAVLVAALSQPTPTPTAEPMQTCGVCGREYPASDRRETCPICWPGFGEYAAVPPSIDDLAPGATFEYPVRWEVGAHKTVSGRKVAHMIGLVGITQWLDEFDPSTIRDVTPPPGSTTVREDEQKWSAS